jgi:succinate dehydrogenase / fumarate reductase flavoprotein subunit
MVHHFDVLVVGAGGAGLRAAVEIPEPYTCAVLSKVHPLRSHTGAAQGGVCAALANEEEDSWEWHAFDTVKGSDYLGDQDAIEVMCYDAIRAIIELEHMGMPFSRTKQGKIAQRRFGGHTRPSVEDPNKRVAVRRACYAADRTGHVMLHTLYENCLKNRVNFFSEFFVTDVIVEDNVCRGVVAIEIRTGEVHTFHAKATIFATGGLCRAFRITSNAHAGTGDGTGVAYRRGVPLEDMEFVQFHPTGLWRLGILVSEAARGEGGILRNKNNEPFMERYAPTVKDLAPRDLVSRAILTEMREGRGIVGSDGTTYIGLDLTHLDRSVLDEKLPEITGFARTYLGVDPAKQPIPIQPTAHYAMGGIPTDKDGRVQADEHGTPVVGFYAAGECACVSVHGANRLGTNSLLDLVVFGRRTGKAVLEFLRQGAEHQPLPANAEERTRYRINWVKKGNGGQKVGALRTELQNQMMENVGIFRTAEGLTRMVKALDAIRDRYSKIQIDDKGNEFNTDLLDALELENLIDSAEAITYGALARQESRGGHSREDFPNRDDKDWMKHTFAYYNVGQAPTLKYKPVVVTKYQPMERKY